MKFAERVSNPNFLSAWDIAATLLLANSVIFLGWHVGVGHPVGSGEVALDLLTTLFFIGDIALMKSLKRKTHNGLVQPRWLSLATLVPWPTILFFTGTPSILLYLPAAVRLCRIRSVYERFILRKKEFQLPGWCLPFGIAICGVLIIHLLACGWLYFTPQAEKEDLYTAYNIAIYWCVTTVSTVGYGDVTPKTNPSRLFTMVVMMIGAALYGVIVGQISRIMMASDRRQASTNEKLESMAAFFRFYDIPGDLQKNVLKFYNHLLSSKLNEDEEKILADLPEGLRAEIKIYMNVKLIAKVTMFQGVSQSCLVAAAAGLEQIYFNPDSPIIRKGEQGGEMYLIGHGCVRVHVGDHFIATLEQGAFFGEMALIDNIVRTADVTASSYCYLYRLQKAQFIELVAKHDDLRKNVENIIAARQAKPKAA